MKTFYKHAPSAVLQIYICCISLNELCLCLCPRLNTPWGALCYAVLCLATVGTIFKINNRRRPAHTWAVRETFSSPGGGHYELLCHWQEVCVWNRGSTAGCCLLSPQEQDKHGLQIDTRAHKVLNEVQHGQKVWFRVHSTVTNKVCRRFTAQTHTCISSVMWTNHEVQGYTWLFN